MLRLRPCVAAALWLVTAWISSAASTTSSAQETPPPQAVLDSSSAPQPNQNAATEVDASTLRQKVMCGYQGWFRCPGDGSGEGWLHWSRRRDRITPASLTVEMWPDTTELTPAERFSVPGFVHADGRPAHLFSSAHPRTVQRHFEWMREYGIDGVFVQRFLVNLNKPSFDDVLAHVRASAAETGRTYAICYDLSGAPADRLVQWLADDWKRLVDEERITQDERYLHHDGRPVLFVWGFYSDRFEAAVAHRLIDFLKEDRRYAVTLVGGCQWYWRREPDPEWARAFRRFDIICPWNVGNWTMVDGKKVAATNGWAEDIAEARTAGMEFMPVIYPGFGWTNLKGEDAQDATIPRRNGEFLWEQFVRAAELDVQMAYVAMFDEVDEATAIFKVSNDPPIRARFQTYEGLPADAYLRLTGEGTRVLRSERPAGSERPALLPTEQAVDP